VVALFAATCAVVLVIVAMREEPRVRGYAQFEATSAGCELKTDRALNALGCRRLDEDKYRVLFSVSLEDTVPLVTVGAAGGRVAAVPSGPRSVDVTFDPVQRYPTTVSVLLP
jgi:hypothetical protein